MHAESVIHPVFDVTRGWAPHQDASSLCCSSSCLRSASYFGHSHHRCRADAGTPQISHRESSTLFSLGHQYLLVGVKTAPARQTARARGSSDDSLAFQECHLVEVASMSISAEPSASRREEDIRGISAFIRAAVLTTWLPSGVPGEKAVGDGFLVRVWHSVVCSSIQFCLVVFNGNSIQLCNSIGLHLLGVRSWKPFWRNFEISF